MPALRRFRWLAASAAVLVLWCTALDGALRAADAAMLSGADETFSAAAMPQPPPQHHPQLLCCDEAHASDVWSVPPAVAPDVSAPASSVTQLVLQDANIAPHVRAERPLPAHRATLFQQSVLIRI